MVVRPLKPQPSTSITPLLLPGDQHVCALQFLSLSLTDPTTIDFADPKIA
jgi:hypothetical protein